MIRNLLITTVATTLVFFAVALPADGQDGNVGQGMSFTVYAVTTEANPPQLGEWVAVAWDIHELGGTAEVPAPVGDPIGRMIGACIAITEASEGHCVGSAEINGLGTLVLGGKVRHGPGPGLAVTGGTGEFAGAEGVLHETRVPGTVNDRVDTFELTGFNQP